MSKTPLHKNTLFYSILDEYVTHINNKIIKMKSNIANISDKMIEYTEKFENNTISKDEVDHIIVLQNEFIDLGQEKKYLNEKLLTLIEFNTLLSLNKIEKDNEMFNTLMNHFIDVEKYEFCSNLENIIKNL